MATAISENKIAIIGGGHIGTALAEGLVHGKTFKPSDITVSTRKPEQSTQLKKLGIEVINDNRKAVENAQQVFLAVKPADIEGVVSGMRGTLSGKTLVSMAAGIPVSSLKKWYVDSSIEVARIMPNIGIALNQGVIGVYNHSLSVHSQTLLTNTLSRLGSSITVDMENKLDVLTVLSGSGPGIVSSVISQFEANAVRFGFSAAEAQTLTLQTFKSTLASLEQTGISAVDMTNAVATKGGVTETILMSLKDDGFERDFKKALDAGVSRIEKLKEL